MKKIIFLLIVVSSSLSKGQSIPSSCTAHDSVYWKYRDDADKMTIRRAYHISDSYKDSISVDKQLRERYFQALFAVYNATTIPARDSVIKLCNIHVYGNNVNSLSIRADSTLQWVQNVKAHVIPCGNQKMDYLMNKYFMKEIKHYPHLFNATTDIIFQTDTNFNCEPLADTLKTIPGIFLADGAMSMVGEGTNVEDSITTNYVWLVYSVGWDDDGMPIGSACPSGCLYRKFWQFKVYNDCSVEYGGTFGAPLNVGLTENKLNSENVKVYPNPVRDLVNINFEFGQTQFIKIEIANSLGQIIMSLTEVNQKNEINLSSLPPGLYSMKIKSEFFVRTIKLIKE